jgi:adenylate cyclase class 2
MRKYEVEQKFRVRGFDQVRHALLSLSPSWRPRAVQRDRYFAHPNRDFTVTDEALRIRSTDEHHVITYKGPRQQHVVKTRREIEIPLGSGSDRVKEFSGLLEALGFRSVAVVTKSRQPFAVAWSGRSFNGTLDEVDSLGDFVELELVVSEDGIAEAQLAVQGLADQLGLTDRESRSYLELVLAAQVRQT